MSCLLEVACRAAQRTRLPFVPILMALLLAAPVAWAQPATDEQAVLGIGASRGRPEEVAAGREAAVQAALTMAVSRALADAVSPEVMVGHFQAINETILNSTDQFVRDYKVLTDASAAGTYRVVVRATVLVGRLKEALKAAGVRLAQSSYPRVLVCVAERRAGEIESNYWWRGRAEVIENLSRATLSQALAGAGFLLVAPDGPVAVGTYPAELSDAEALVLGRQYQAEVVVVGMASAQEIAPVPTEGSAAPVGARTYRADLSVKAYRLADGQQIAFSRKETVATGQDGTDGREALRAAAAQAGEELAAQMSAAWFKQAAVGSRLEVVVKGVGGKIANFVRFRGALGNLSGVDNLQLKTMMSDQAILSLNYQGTARALADAISAQAFDGFTVTVEGVFPETIQVTLVPR